MKGALLKNFEVRGVWFLVIQDFFDPPIKGDVIWQKLIQHNEKIIEEYQELLNIIQRNSNEIIIEDATYKINDIVKDRFRRIIECITKAN